MNGTDAVSRAVGWAVGPPVELVGQHVEEQLREAAPPLPQLPWWAVPVLVVVGIVGAVFVEDGQEEARERAEPKVERGTTTEREESGAEEIVAALDTLEVEYPPVPTDEDVKAAYRARAMETHPDQGGAAEAFVQVQKAWQRLPERQGLSGDGHDGDVTQES